MPAMTTSDEPITMSVPEVARMLGVSRKTVYRAIKRGELPVFRVGRRVVVVPGAMFFDGTPAVANEAGESDAAA